jgi:hypothetical protein
MPSFTQTIIAASTASTASSYTEDFDIDISGAFTGTVELQRSFDAGSTYVPVKSFIYPDAGTVRVAGTALYRINTGANFVGSVKVRLANNI